jgi:nitroreductase
MSEQAAEHTDAADTLTQLLEARFSCRGFLPDPVPRPIIERILEMAQHSASWCNTQPWRVIITEGDATQQVSQGFFEAAAQGQVGSDIPFPERYEGVSQARRRECAWQLYDSVGIERGDRAASAIQAAKNYELFGAPHLAIITSEKLLGPYGGVDCGLYIQSFLLAAQSLGVATIAQAAIAMSSPYIHEHFGLGDDRQVVCGISFGYADPSHPANAFRTTRAPLDDAVTWVSDGG